MRRLAIFAAVALALGGALMLRLHAQPLGGMPPPFSASNAPPAPDYAAPDAWAAWPGRPSAAAVAPPGMTAIDPAAAKADVFFIHPTTYLANQKWNAAYDEPGRAMTALDQGVMGNQASVFNGCCRIYAPRYRQATLASFTRDSTDRLPALDLAYADVARAFDDYVAHENHGRPFIIASHSQGSLHALRLLQEKIIGTPLQKRLVAAYVIGGFVPTEIEKAGLPICRSATATGCIVDWNSVSERGVAARRNRASFMWFDGRYQLVGDSRIVCVDPLSWRAGASSAASANIGSLPPSRAGRSGLVAGVTGAACEPGGMLVVDIVAGERMRFFDPLSVVGIYHDLDYNLFYGSLRQNAIDRVNAFLRQ